MSTATGPLNTGHRQGEIVPLALASAVQVYKGAAAAVVAGTGYGTPLVPATTTHEFVGVWSETILAGSGNGTTSTQILRDGSFSFSQTGTVITTANLKQRVYFSDDNTVTLTAGPCFAGLIDAVDAAGNVWVDIRPAVQKMSAANESVSLVLAAATLVTNVAGAAQTFVSKTIPANSLKVGDRIRVRGQLIGTTRTSTDTCALNLLFGTTTAAALAAAFAHATTNFLYFEFEMVVQAIGASGSVMGAGLVNGGTAGATTTGLNLAATTFDTTVAETISISGTFSASNTTDQITVNIFDVDVLRA